MNAGAQYGLLMAVVFVVAYSLGPIPMALLFTLMAVQLAAGAAVVWRRTRLPWSTAGNAVAAVGAAAAAVLFARQTPLFALTPATIIIFAAAAAAPLTLAIEARTHREEWRSWREHMEGMSAWDILLGRHIPQLTRYSRSGV